MTKNLSNLLQAKNSNSVLTVVIGFLRIQDAIT